MVRIPRKKVGRGNTSVADKKSHLHTEKVQAPVFVSFNDPFPLFLKKEKNIGDAGDRTRGLSHAKRTRYHCATSPDI